MSTMNTAKKEKAENNQIQKAIFLDSFLWQIFITEIWINVKTKLGVSNSTRST